MAKQDNKVVENSKNVKAEEKKGPGRQAGPGAIQCGKEKHKEFAQIWNGAANFDGDLKIKIGDKEIGGAMAKILTDLRAAKIANEHTDASQVRSFATKVRDAGHELHQFTVRLDKRKVIAAWQTSSDVDSAFKKAVEKGVFDGLTLENLEKLDEKELKAKRASFRACVNQMIKNKVPLKQMGRTRAAKIDDAKFIAAWMSSSTVAEVKEKLVAEKVCGEKTQISTLKSKYNTLKKAGHDLKKLQSGEELADLMKYAAQFAEGNFSEETADDGADDGDGEEYANADEDDEDEDEENDDENLDLDDVV